MPTVSQAQMGGQHPLPTILVHRTWSPDSLNNPFNPAETATLRVLGVDPEILADVVKENLQEELFDEMACNAQLLSQIPSDERTGALIDLWLAKARQRVIDERMRQKAQDKSDGTVAAEMDPDARFQMSRHEDKAVIATLPAKLAAEYRSAMASVDLGSLSSRFFSKKDPNKEHVCLNSALKSKLHKGKTKDPEPEVYTLWILAAICDSVPSIDHWPSHITDAFVARDWKFGLFDGEVVLVIAKGREDALMVWFRENCSKHFIHNNIMEVRRKA